MMIETIRDELREQKREADFLWAVSGIYYELREIRKYLEKKEGK